MFSLILTSKPVGFPLRFYDTMDRLGFYEAPYFEAYPIDEDTARFSNSEVDLMMETIERELNKE